MRPSNYRTRDNSGENHPNSKLTREDVLQIRELSDKGETCTSLSQRFGVSRTAINSILKGRTWGHLKS